MVELQSSKLVTRVRFPSPAPLAHRRPQSGMPSRECQAGNGRDASEVLGRMNEPIVPVPLPSADDVDLVPPMPDEVLVTARAMATAAAPRSGLTEVQRAVLEATIESMTGTAVDLTEYDPMGPREFAEAMARRDAAFRVRMVQ